MKHAGLLKRSGSKNEVGILGYTLMKTVNGDVRETLNVFCIVAVSHCRFMVLYYTV